ncbi:TonB-dependent siderophore receptor protein [Herbaspirillum frisingense GSF30]|uniref:TonB-dependent siderophore receptor protein n=1 Tax=Herbaspirillum frisingense GSF30 TaxID=864073 RepID=A0AAI9IBM6_9BURK|nr:TonB-dependent receptor [Herbaspirillum frisingense]EOA03132.1 TonB-dependent siderophore receptor protein [Herbaspirillum frisingense GSF30]
MSMPFTARLNPLAAALALAFLAPLPALAQTTATTATTDAKDQAALPTVTVNASADASADGLPAEFAGGQVARGSRLGVLGNVDNLDSPVRSVAYTRQLIADQQAHGVGDVLKNDPVVRTTRGFGNFQESYMIRGFIANSDDLMYNGLFGILPRQYVASEMIERVEVLYGASAFLNGATPGDAGLGGTINILPKRASSEALTEVTLGYESGNSKSAAIDVSRRLGADERLGVRVNAARHAGGTGVSNEKRETNVFSLGVDYRGNDFRLSADLGVQENNLSNMRPSVTIGSGLTAVPTAPSGSSNYAQPWSYSNARDIFGTVRGEWDLSASTTAWAAFGARQGTENNSLSGVRVNNASTGAASTYRFDNARQDDVATGEIGVRTQFNTGTVSHKLVAAASAYSLDSRNAYGMSTSYALATNLYNPSTYARPALVLLGNDLSDPQTTIKTQLMSAVVSDTLGFYDNRLLVTLGVRQQQLKSDGYAYNTHVNNSHYDQSATSPMAGVVFKVLKNLSLYGNYIEGLQQGKQITDTTAANYGQILAPYKSKQKEVGVKYELGGLGLGAAFFTTDRPLSYKDVSTGIESTNGKQRNRGVELTAYGEVTRGVRLLSGITFLDAKQVQTNGGTNNGKYAIGVPKMQANAGVEYDIPGVRGLTVNGRATYTATQYVDAANKLEVPSWVRYDLGARYLTDIGGRAVTFRAAIENLANRNYWQSAGGASNSGYLVLGNPRTFSTSVSVAF